MTTHSLDLRGTPCPVNFIRCKLALEALQCGEQLNVQLDRGEPEEMVVPGAQGEFYPYVYTAIETEPNVS